MPLNSSLKLFYSFVYLNWKDADRADRSSKYATNTIGEVRIFYQVSDSAPIRNSPWTGSTSSRSRDRISFRAFGWIPRQWRATIKCRRSAGTPPWRPHIRALEFSRRYEQDHGSLNRHVR